MKKSKKMKNSRKKMKRDENTKIDHEDEKIWKRYGLSRSVTARYGPI